MPKRAKIHLDADRLTVDSFITGREEAEIRGAGQGHALTFGPSCVNTCRICEETYNTCFFTCG